GQISVLNSSGARVDPFDLGNYTITTVFSQPKNELDFVYGGRANAQRKLDFTFPTSLKVGVDERDQIRDMRSPFPRWNFVGPDRVANTADDLAGRYDILNTTYADGGGPYSGVANLQ